ncbi:alpha/beta fold hydrolase [Gordonia sp. SID5947]|uniref:alpha/beta fold hydrolase n=1 Tax=Gordonia sp. SID5947 TaxID=2690315 RepID=UPI001369BC68|nr:alpha/beta hydrolase [Gordonia sp. SID5947]MYR07929.1 alpha/beta fold hydrolase [Gordonia sp. SID5947]
MRSIRGMHVVVDGAGPPVVLCGGLGGNWFDWDEVAGLLADEHTVIRIDRPGYGMSAPEPGFPTVRGEAARIRVVLDELGVDVPAVLVGHSLGGFYAEAFARLYPELTAGLVWLDTSLAQPAPGRCRSSTKAARARRVARFLTALGLTSLFGPVVYRVALGSKYPDGLSSSTRRRADRVFCRGEYLEALMVELSAFDSLGREVVDIRSRFSLRGPGVVAAVQGRRRTWASARWIKQQKSFAVAMSAAFVVLGPAAHHVMIDRAPVVAAVICRLTVRNDHSE